jgi:hypothetical protein
MNTLCTPTVVLSNPELEFIFILLAQPEKLLRAGDGIGDGVLAVDDDGDGRIGEARFVVDCKCIRLTLAQHLPRNYAKNAHTTPASAIWTRFRMAAVYRRGWDWNETVKRLSAAMGRRVQKTSWTHKVRCDVAECLRPTRNGGGGGIRERCDTVRRGRGYRIEVASVTSANAGSQICGLK